MGKTEEKIKADRISTKLILEGKNKLIADRCYPSRFNMPLNIQFEVTSNCNLRCKHCYNASGLTNKKDAVTGEQWVAFCKNLVKKGGIMQATISGGEPLLLGKYLWEMMNVLHNDGTVFNLISNGYAFNKDVIDNLKKYRFYWVQISLDNFREELHDKFRGVQGSWRKAIVAAYHVALAGIPLRIASTITNQDLEHLENYIQMAINLGASYYVIGEVMPSGRAFENPEILLSNEGRDYFYSEMDRLVKKYEKQISILVSGTQRLQLEYSSSGAIDGAILRPDGSIRLDCGCPFVIGNILKDDISQVWKEKSNCWQHPLVKKFIESCDPINGNNSFHRNYKEKDIYI